MAVKKEKLTQEDKKGIYPRSSDGMFVAPYFLEGKRKVCYGKTLEEAATKRREVLVKVAQGKITAESHQTVEQHIREWLAEYKASGVVSRTYEKVASTFFLHVFPFIGKKRLEVLTRADIQFLVYRWIEQDGLKVSTSRLQFARLKMALQMAVLDEKISKNPCDGVKFPKEWKEERTIPSLEVLNDILACAQQQETQINTIVPLLLTTGLRRGELLGLHWSDLDLTRGVLRVRRNVQYEQGKVIATKTKTAQSMREILLTTLGIEALKRQKERIREMLSKAGTDWIEQDIVFPNNQGGYRSPQSLWGQFTRFLKKHGYPAMRLHDTRHAAATVLLSLGVSLKMVQSFLGHSSSMLSTTWKYLHVIEGEAEQAREKMERAYTPAQQKTIL